MTAALSPAELATLVEVARESVRHAVLERRSWRPDPAEYDGALQAPGAAFVTLRRHGRLRGCIGSLVASQALVSCVADRARAAALDDPRFEPVAAGELSDLDVEVSVLTPSTPLDVSSYDELVRTVRPGVDGVTVDAGRHRATLLPAVWEELPEPAQFLAALWRKAGLRAGEWPFGIRVLRYGAQLWPPPDHA